MSKLSLTLDGFDKMISNINKMEKDTQKVLDRTLSDFRSRGPGWVSQEVVKEYNVKKGEVSKGGKIGTVFVQKTSDDIFIKYKGRPLTPVHFSLTPKASKGFRKGKTLIPANHLNIMGGRTPVAAYAAIPRKYKVSMTVKKGKKEQITGKYDTPVFLAPAKKGSGTMIPFQRTSNDAREIVGIKTVSLPQMIENDKVQEGIGKAIDEKLGKRLDYHMSKCFKK